MDLDGKDLEAMLREIRDSVQFATRRTMGRIFRSHTQQLEAYVSLISFLQPRFPFPPINSTAVAPDLALLLATKILERRPSIILEAGSGVSTLVAGYCVERNGFGRIISLEHDSRYAKETMDAVRMHGLDQYVEVVYAPLVEMDSAGEQHTWYDLSFLRSMGPSPIDLFFVDGPPGKLRKLSRYPALPILSEMLSDDPLIIVDDAKRVDESEMIFLWLKRYPWLSAHYIKTMKGTVLLSRTLKLIE